MSEECVSPSQMLWIGSSQVNCCTNVVVSRLHHKSTTARRSALPVSKSQTRAYFSESHLVRLFFPLFCLIFLLLYPPHGAWSASLSLDETPQVKLQPVLGPESLWVKCGRSSVTQLAQFESAHMRQVQEQSSTQAKPEALKIKLGCTPNHNNNSVIWCLQIYCHDG